MEGYIGEIRIFAGNFAPVGWHLCDGSVLPIAGNEALYSLLGIAYGGNGTSNFGLPDLRGRLPIGQGTGSGMSQRTMGQLVGTETVTMTPDCWPAHSHALMASQNAANSVSPGGNALATTTTTVPLYDVLSNPQAFDNRAVTSVGGNQEHTNLMPASCVNFIIATTGTFPQRKN